MYSRIFFIQNQIALLVALKVIEVERLNREECFFIYGRGMKKSIKGIHSCNWDDFRMKYTRNILINKRIIKETKSKCDQFLDTISDQFHFYTASFDDWFLVYFKGHKKCAQYYFLEEGTGSLFTLKQRRKKAWSLILTKRFLYYLKIYISHDFSYFFTPLTSNKLIQEAKHIYTITPNGFIDFQNRKEISLPFSKNEAYRDIKCVLVFSSLVETKVVPLDIYLKVLDGVLEKITKTEKIIYYKFHPQQIINKKYISDYESIIEKYRSKSTFISLDKNVALENIAYTSKATFYIDISSIGMYAQLCGSKVYTFSNRISELYPNFKNFKIPELMKQFNDNKENHI